MAKFVISSIIPNSFRKMRNRKNKTEKRKHLIKKIKTMKNRKIEVKVITAAW